MAVIRSRRVRDAGMGGLVQQPAALGAHRQHPAGRSRGTLLRHAGTTCHGGVTQTKWPPTNPGRFMFVAGALAVIRYAKIHGTNHRPWLTALLARRPTKVAAIALANKLARMAWAMMAKGERYRQPVALAA